MAKKNIGLMPLGDRVVVKPMDTRESNKTPSGIIIPETVSKEKPERGTVVAVGRGRVTDDGKVIPLSVKVGDTVLFSKYSPDEIKIEDEEYFIMGESSILAILE